MSQNRVSKLHVCVIVLLASFAQAQQPYSSTISVSRLLSENETAPLHSIDDGSTSNAPMALAASVHPQANSARCASGEATKDECREHWKPMLRESFAWVLAQNGMNLALGPDFRTALTHGNFFSNYVDAATAPHRFTHWDDGDEFLVNYVGHPMMGSVVDRLWVQNDPKAADLEVGKSRAYWTSRGRALLWTAAYTAQWKVGPLGEASIGNVGKDIYASPRTGKLTNGAGLVDFVVTPVVGTAWNIGEDTLDKYVAKKLRAKTANPALLTALSSLTPTRSMANIMRLKQPWYRESK